MWSLIAETDWSWVSSLGPFSAFAVIAVAAIAYLRHELTLSQERVAKIADQRFELAQQAIPAVQTATEAIRASTELIERAALQLGESNQVLADSRQALQRAMWVLEKFDSPPRSSPDLPPRSP